MDHSWQDSATFLLGSPTSPSLKPSVGGCQPYLKIKPASGRGLGWRDWKLNCVQASWKKCWVKCPNAKKKKKKKICHVQSGNTPTLECEVRHDPSTIRAGRLPVYDVKLGSTESDLLQEGEISRGTDVWFKWKAAGIYQSDSGQMIHYCLILYNCSVNI